MSSADASKFIVSSDFPLPEKVSSAKVTVIVPAGATVPSRKYTTLVALGNEALIYRIAFQCSRTGSKMYVAGNAFMNFKFADASFNVYVSSTNSGQKECCAMVYSGVDHTKERLEEDVTFTFYVSGFKLP